MQRFQKYRCAAWAVPGLAKLLFGMAVVAGLLTSPLWAQSGASRTVPQSNADDSLFVMTYTMIGKSDAEMSKMLEDPRKFQNDLCKHPLGQASQWVYMNALFHIDALSQTIDAAKQHLSLASGSAPHTDKLLAVLATRREIFSNALSLMLDKDVVLNRLEANQLEMDEVILQTGADVLTTPIDPRLENDVAKVEIFPLRLEELTRKACAFAADPALKLADVEP